MAFADRQFEDASCHDRASTGQHGRHTDDENGQKPW
jgi:hypothetical protein